MSSVERPVSVGIGDVEAPGVVRYAAREAARRGARLRLVHAYTVPPSTVGTVYGYDIPGSYRDAGEALLAGAAAAAIAEQPQIEVENVLVRSGAARLMERESRLAQLVVVGRDMDKPFLLRLHDGRIAHHLVRHSHCPVVVVPAEWDDPASCGCVLAISEGDHLSRSTIDFAVASARHLGCEVTILQVDRHRHPDDAGNTALEATVQSYDDVCLVVAERAGSRVAGQWSGPLAHPLIAHAACPVAVVPLTSDAS